MTVLRSYVTGAWFEPAEDGVPVFDAVTGEEVARISSAGIDMAAALDHGRLVGGPTLRELTFHERAALLKALGSSCASTGTSCTRCPPGPGRPWATPSSTSTAASASCSLREPGQRELPNDTVLVEGDVEPLGRGGPFVGQHILTPLRGVAVQVNAFNFPVWGPLEKFAPAFLAGVPSVVKPASSTAYLTARLVELMVESGVLPAGSLQLVCGSVGDLFDHLTDQDLVSFTGSASTAQQLRPHPAMVTRSVRFNAEADSLNCSILGPDAGPGTPSSTCTSSSWSPR